MNKRSILIVPYVLFILGFLGFLLYFLSIRPGGAGGNITVVWVLTAFASGGMLMMAIYGVTLFLFRRKEKVALFFSLICISASVRFFVMEGSETVRELIPVFPPGAALFIRYITIALMLIGLHRFVYEIFIKPKLKRISNTIDIITIAIFTLGGITGAVRGYDLMAARFGIFLISLAALVHIAIQVYKSHELKRNRLNWLYFASLLLYIILSVLPAFFTDALPHSAVFSNMMMIISHVIILSERYTRTINDNELLDKLNRSKSELFATVSHNMKTPLTVIATDIQLAEKYADKKQIDKTKELLQEAWQETMMLADQVTGAVNFSRSQEYNREMRYIDIGKVIEPVLKMYDPVLKKRGNSLIKNIEKTPEVWGNADMLTTVLTNILDNANRHTKNGIINVNIAEINGGEECCLEIKDNGEGIEPELLPNVFDRGVSGAASSGLGLSIVKSIMEMHNGEVELESEAGKGTCVKLLFIKKRNGTE